ncbi:hypothetical protein QA641_17780 [Bradyrhizobium sp. CB1650]|uniref:hypothetical protein n=1 Tax=Bradyrhizobium sp. CB1650 TaxID=3039153 RepID=UPI002434C780|nr:hypothetical protein [Bradyrhizobium sp. CB1650]WGD55567.1 hypothetical protein QA641_17780 [Bradyrhizobium sp. CB1650]
MRWLIPALQMVIAFASAFNVIRFRLDNLLIEGATELDRLTLSALVAIAVLTTAVLTLCWRVPAIMPRRAALALLMVALSSVCGFVPQTLQKQRRTEEYVASRAREEHRDNVLVSELRWWAEDIDKRIAASHPLEPDQAWALLDAVSSAGHRDDGPNSPSAQALELLQMAIAAGLIDVNADVPGHRLKDPIARPLFLQFYMERIEPLRYSLARQDWEIVRLLASSAELSRPDAAPLLADLKKTVVPGPSRFISLK